MYCRIGQVRAFLLRKVSEIQTRPLSMMMTDEERAQRLKLEQLRQEHGDLDAAINALSTAPVFDQLQMTRLKKRKLQLKDLIAQIEDDLTPDIIA